MVPLGSPIVQQLETSADSAVNLALQMGAPGQGTPTGEVGFVAAVVLGAVTGVAASWRTILQPLGLSVRIVGVFCHQSPQVEFTNTKGNRVSCELADLLVVVDDLSAGVPSNRRAALIQAKMASGGGGKRLRTKGELIQLELYRNWPQFVLPNKFATRPRDFLARPSTVGRMDCGKYGLIERQPSLRWMQQKPARKMPAGGDQLGTYIARMLQSGTHNYGRVAHIKGEDWSETVGELLSVTLGMSFSHAAGFRRRQPRQNVQIAYAISEGMYTTMPLYLRGGVIPTGGRPEGPGEEGTGEELGISVIHIGVERLEDGED